MSKGSRRRNGNNLCVECQKRPAKFMYRGRVHADHEHDLCMQCHRAGKDRARSGETWDFTAAWCKECSFARVFFPGTMPTACDVCNGDVETKAFPTWDRALKEVRSHYSTAKPGFLLVCTKACGWSASMPATGVPPLSCPKCFGPLVPEHFNSRQSVLVEMEKRGLTRKPMRLRKGWA